MERPGALLRHRLPGHAAGAGGPRPALAGRQAGRTWARTTLSDKPLALDTALDGLEPRQREIVEMRFFGGMTVEEVAAALGVFKRRVRHEWVKARAWLYDALYPSGE